MPNVYPFRALRPKPQHATKVASAPYDVVSRAEAKDLAKDNPMSFFHVTRPEIDLADTVEPYNEQVYAQGKTALEKLEKDGVLARDDAPSYYVYELRRGKRFQLGVAFTADIADYDSGLIKKHELTRSEKEDDRVRHIETTGAQTGKVFLLHKNGAELHKALNQARTTLKPVYDVTGADGSTHRVWQITDPKIAATVEQQLKAQPAFYIADGHHRAAAASRVAAARRQKGAKADDPSQRFLVVSFWSVFADLQPYHRVLKDLGQLFDPQLLRKLGETFDVKQGRPRQPLVEHEFAMSLKGIWYTFRPKPGSYDDKDVVASLDASILQDKVFKDILGIDDPRTTPRLDFIGGSGAEPQIDKRLRQGWAAGFLLYPTSVDSLIAVADAGKLMPPKSTWFDPKLRDGLLVHRI